MAWGFKEYAERYGIEYTPLHERDKITADILKGIGTTPAIISAVPPQPMGDFRQLDQDSIAKPFVPVAPQDLSPAKATAVNWDTYKDGGTVATRKANIFDNLGYATDRLKSGVTFGVTDLADKAIEKAFGYEPYEEIEYSKATQNVGSALDFAGGLVSGGALAKALGKTVGKSLMTKAGKVWDAAKGAWVKVPDAAKPVIKTGARIGAGATGYETVRGAFDPDYAGRRETFPSQFGASVRGGVGDTVSLAGSALEWKGYEEAAKKLKELGTGVSEGYESEYVPFTWQAVFNPNWWANNVARTIPTTAALIPAMFLAYKLGAKGAALRGFGKFGQVVIGSLAGTTLSRPLESALEAGAVFEETGDAKKAQDVYDANMKLAALDSAQLALAFAPAPVKGASKFGKAAIAASKTKPGKFVRATTKLAGVGVTEGLEEGYQEAVSTRATGEDNRSIIQQILRPTPELAEAMAIGGIFGIGIGGAGVINDVYTEAKSVDNAIRSQVAETLPNQAKLQMLQTIDNYMAEGMNEEEATIHVLELLAETEEGREVIIAATQTVASEYVNNSGDIQQLVLERLAESNPAVLDKAGDKVYDSFTGTELTVTDDSAPDRFTVVNAYGQQGTIMRSDVSFDKPETPKMQAMEQGQAEEGMPIMPSASITDQGTRVYDKNTGEAFTVVLQTSPEFVVVEDSEGGNTIMSVDDLTTGTIEDEITASVPIQEEAHRNLADNAQEQLPEGETLPEGTVVQPEAELTPPVENEAQSSIEASETALKTDNEPAEDFQKGETVLDGEGNLVVVVNSGNEKTMRVKGSDGKARVINKADASRTVESSESTHQSGENVPVVSGKTATVKTERGTKVKVEYAVVSADDLIASHDTGTLQENPAYPQEMQPRDRGRMNYEMQIADITQRLEPEWLGENPKTAEGAPIVGEDMLVESGNGRVIAMKRIYNSGHENAAKYKKWLLDNVDKFGLNKEAVDGVENPVLVRVRKSEVNRETFAIEANDSSTAAMSPMEMAKSDASRLSQGLLDSFVPSEDGAILTPANRNFIRDFLDVVVGKSAMGRYITKDGSVSQEGVARIRNAIFAKAYGEVDALEKIAESTDNNIKTITNALLMLGPRFAKIKAGMDSGSLYQLDITSDIADAARKLSQLREEGKPVSDYLAETSMFGEELSPMSKKILAIFDQNKRSAKKLFDIFGAYADIVVGLGSPNQTTMFDDGSPMPTQDDLLDAILQERSKEDDSINLFQDESASGGKDTENVAGTENIGEAGRRIPEDSREKREEVRSDILKENGIAYNQDSLFRDGENNAEGRKRLKESLEQLVLFEKHSNISSIQRTVDRSGGSKLLGLSITRKAAKTGRIDLRGAKVTSPQELATLAQVFRNSSYETFRIIYLKGNEIVAHEAITSRLPGAAAAFAESIPKSIYKMKQRMERLGADGYYLLHNHPSGNSVPSYQDLSLTRSFGHAVQGLLGHLVINSNEYSFHKPGRASELDMLITEYVDFHKSERDPVHTPEKDHPLLGAEINSPEKLARLYKQLQTSDNMTTIIYVTSKNDVRAIQEVPNGLFNDIEKAADYIRGRSKEFGARNAFIVTDNYSIYKEKGHSLVENNILLDAVHVKQANIYDSAREMLGTSQDDSLRWMGKDIPQYGLRVQEDTSSRHKLGREQKAPIFYSQLQKILEQKMPNKAMPDHVLSIINGGQVKAEEVKWSGIEEWLNEQGGGRVSKEDVLGFLKANDLQVEEDYSSQDYNLYQLPGGENYRELLFILPSDNQYKSPHWPEPNVLANVRFNDRTNADGEKILFIEEIQSDWHQDGRTKGYKKPLSDAEYGRIRDAARLALERNDLLGFDNMVQALRAIRDHEDFASRWDIADEDVAALKEYRDNVETGTVPDAPFKTTWHEFVLKRMLRYAAENGYDRIAWTTGEQQAERYDLSKYISELAYWKDGDGTWGVSLLDSKGRALDEWNPREGLTKNDLEGHFGKDVANTIINDEGKSEPEASEYINQSTGKLDTGVMVIQKDDLKVGGEGMKGFYDRMIPSFLNKYAKKWGARVERSNISPPETSVYPDWKSHLIDNAAEYYQNELKSLEEDFVDPDTGSLVLKTVEGDWRREVASQYGSLFNDNFIDSWFKDQGKDTDHTVHSLPITDAMKESVLYAGQPMFKLDPAFAEEAIANIVARDARPAPEAMKKSKMQAANAVVRAFTGKDIIPFKGGNIQGVALGDQVFLNENTQDPILYVTKHEIVHTLEKTDSESYEKLVKIVKQYFDGNADMFAHYRNQGYSEERLWGEYTSDVVSEVMEQPGFWQSVREKSPEVIKAIIDVLDSIISKFKKSVAKDQSMLKYVTDLEALKNEISGVTAEVLSKPKRRSIFDLRTDAQVAAKAKTGSIKNSKGDKINPTGNTNRLGDKMGTVKLPKRYSLYGVGKDIGGKVYLHKQYEDVLPEKTLANAKSKLPADFEYTGVAYDRATGQITFTYSPDFDSAHEPTVGKQIVVKPDGSTLTIKQKDNPQIWHHKWLWVKDDYTGFDVEESMNRSEKWLAIPNIDKSRIGYKDFWESNVVPLLEAADYSPEEIKIANATSRNAGAVGANAITPKYVANTATKGETILDFGAGKAAAHAQNLQKQGYNVTAYEFGSNIQQGIHDPAALERQYDTVYASNVLNVQSSENMLKRTLQLINSATKKGGRAVFNYPGEPRKAGLTPKRVAEIIKEEFGNAPVRVGGSSSTPLWEVVKTENTPDIRYKRNLLDGIGTTKNVNETEAKYKFGRPQIEPQEFIGPLKGVVIEANRVHRAEVAATGLRTERWKETLSEEQLQDLGAFIEKVENLKSEKDFATIAKEINADPEMKKVLQEYMVTQESMRRKINDYLRDVTDEDYIKFVENYIPHFYINEPGTSKKVSTDKVGKWIRNSPNAKQRKIPTLKEARDLGLVPLTQNIAELQNKWANINWLVATNRKLLSSVKEFTNADGENIIMKANNAPTDWIRVKHPAFARIYARKTESGQTVLYEGEVAVDPEAYKILRQVIEEPLSGGVINAIESFNAYAKKAQLSFSLFHHWALTESAIGALGVKGLILVGKDTQGLGKGIITQPHRVGKKLMEQEDFLRDAIMHGLTLESVSDAHVGKVKSGLVSLERKTEGKLFVGKTAEKARQFNDAWDKTLWTNYHNGLKAYTYYALTEKYISQLPSNATAADISGVKEKIAETINDMYGGQEWASKFWLSPQARQMWQMLQLAPDWTLSNANVAAKAITKAKDPVMGPILRKYWSNMLLSQALIISAMCFAFSGHFPWDNEEGHKTEIEVTAITRRLNKLFGKHEKNPDQRYYMHPGKQIREVVGWVTDPLLTVRRKASPAVHTVIEQISGHSTTGWEMPWTENGVEKNFWSSLPQRTVAAAEKFVPFSIGGLASQTQFAFTFPMRKGMTPWKAVRAYEDVIRMNVDPTFAQKAYKIPAAKAKKAITGQSLLGRLDEACVTNGLDPDKMYRDARSKVVSQYYGEMWGAINHDNMRKADKAAQVLLELDVTASGLKSSAKARGLSEEDYIKAIEVMRRNAGKR